MSLTSRSLESDPTYTFRYTLFDVIVQLKKNHLIAKMGMKTYVIPIDSIELIYKRHIKHQSVFELTIAFRRDKKLKRARLYSDPHQEDFEALWAELLWLRPHADISMLNPKEAYAKMGSHDLPWIAVPSVMICGVLLLAVIGAPLLIHGTDRGQWKLELSEVYQKPELLKNPKSYNVSVAGSAAMDHSLTLVEGKGVDTQTHIILPLYPLNSNSLAETQEEPKRDRELLVALSLRGKGLSRLDQIREGKAVDGILRSIWWEGLGHQAKRGLIDKGVKLSPDLVLIEVGVKRRDDLQIYLMFISILLGVTLLVALYLKPYTVKDSQCHPRHQE